MDFTEGSLTVMTKPVSLNVLELSQRLVAFDTINPPGNESECAEYLCAVLEKAGLQVKLAPFGEGRFNILASAGSSSEKPPLCFTGHIDTVPLGNGSWSMDPFAGQIENGRMYGRGTSDMKCGVAAFIVAIVELIGHLKSGSGVRLIITGGEETGCEGALHLVKNGMIEKGGALIVAEPTANMPLAGHKGALWLRAITSGVTAHGSMPELGDNAIYKAAKGISKLETYNFDGALHPHMGCGTVNVGTVKGGLNLNSVPDLAEFGVDIRTIPGMAHSDVLKKMALYLGKDIDLKPIVDVEAIWTDPQNEWFRRISEIAADVTGVQSGGGAASFFTDASVLIEELGGVPAVIIGPGEPKMAHQTDEYCELFRMDEAIEIYRRAIADWCEL